MKTIRWGIIGTGFIARAAAHDIPLVEGAELRAVASRTRAKADTFAREWSIPIAHGSYRQLIDDDSVDAVYIATPHPSHRDIALACIQAGKAVLVEKAFTATLAGTRQVIEDARSRGVFCMEALWTRFTPAVVRAAELVKDGAIGEIRGAQGDFLLRFDYDPAHRVFNPELGGSSLLDLGVYPLSLAHYFLGDAASAACQARIAPTGVDAAITMTVRHTAGGVSSLASAADMPGPNRFYISGSQGWIDFVGPINSPHAIIVHRDGETHTINCPFVGLGYAHEFAEVGVRLRSGELESPTMPLDATCEVMRIMQDMLDQAGVTLRETEVDLG